MFRYTKSLFRPLLQCQRSYSAVLEKSPLDTLRARLYYQSKKRGILENDLLVGGFADKSRLQNLNEAELKDYDVLINGEIMEWDLFYYLTGKKEAPEDVQKNLAFIKMLEFVDEKRQ